VNAFAKAVHAGAFGWWDEIVLGMLDGETTIPSLLLAVFQRHGVKAELVPTGRGHYIPLPATWDAYLASLSKSSRNLVRDSVRRFEQWAGSEGRLHHAATPAELETGKRVLIQLHHQRWNGVEQSGVFRSPHFLRFHDEIMPVLLQQNALDLMYLSGPDGEPVAAIYNFVYTGKVSFYQSGRKLDLPKNIRPGIVMHAYAIRAAIEAGRREYDFLGGDARYKTQLALASRPIVEVRVVRPSLVEAAHRFVEWTVDQTRSFRHNLRRWTGGSRRTAPAPQTRTETTGGD
jgi:CelD/BcsL family acetyltransferase involved in cellulose biosynthesis